jgi:nucleoside-diphosphate-sugar epimerase
VFVIGRDDTVTDIKDITRGTNGMVMGPLLGQAIDSPMTGFMVHLDDVARMHVMALGPAVRGNQDFLAAFHTIEELHWHDSFEIVKRRFPKQYAEGVFKFDSIKPPVTTPAKVDSTKAERAFGFNFKSYEEQVVSVVEHYLELIDQKRN